ncbi:MAG: TonB-dependent receptor, partial [Rhizomicrobium sp.]
WRVVQTANNYIYEGNPNLQPMRENSWDASIEYFFGKSGQLSADYYLKKPHGWLFYSCQTENDVPEFNGESGTVCKNRNSGPGNFEGFEFTAQSFFDFLPGFWSNFGASANATLLSSFKVLYPYEGDVTKISGVYDAQDTSRYTYNLALYYDTPEFSTRLSYNYRARYRSWVNTDYVQYSPYVNPTSRLDLAINYTPYKFVTFSLEGSNLLKNNMRTWYGKENLLPSGLRMSARTIQLSIRMRN